MRRKYTFNNRILFVCFIMFLQFSINILDPIPQNFTKNVFGDSLVKNVDVNEDEPSSTYVTLNNGMEFILIENNANPMIASVVVVKTGSANENLNNNGVSHMLEHLLFNGTKNRTQEEIYGQMDFFGGYNNAHTSRDFTNFMILLPAEYIDKGLDIQADMLFNSIIPEEKLQKEKDIVIEEIGKDMDREDYINRMFFDRKLYEGTPYALPILGTKNVISNLTRTQIVSYYKTYYVPNNMVGLVIGDFDTSSMVKKLKKYFGHYPPKAIPFEKRKKLKALKDNNIYKIKSDVTNNYISIGLKAPSINSSDFFPFTVLNILLNDNGFLMPGNEDNEKDSNTVKKPEISGIGNIYSEYVKTTDFGTLNIFADLKRGANVDEALHDILVRLNDLSHKFDIIPEDIRGVKTKLKTGELFLKERMHYYGISKANLIANGGHQFMDSYLSSIERVTLKQVKVVARKYLAVDTARFYRRTGKPETVNYVTTIVEPLNHKKSDTIIESHESHSLVKKDPSDKTSDNRKIRNVEKHVLSNGLTLITDENNNSKVFAVHVLFKDRAFHEPDDKTGIADFLHRMLLKGTTTKSDKEIEKALNTFGARLTLFDNPYLPYDDYRTSPEYSFLRLETIEDFYDESLELLADLILNPALDSTKIEEVRNHMVAAITSESHSVYKTAKKLFYENLLNETSMAKSPSGYTGTVSSITSDDLINFHKKYFSPNNMIINIVSNIDTDELVSKVTELFGEAEKNIAVKRDEQTKLNEISEIKEINLKRKKDQSYIFLGYPLPKVEKNDEAPITILSSILANDLGFRLREQQGLAYSIGFSIQTIYDIGWVQCNLGTRKENIETAINGIRQIINEYKNREFEQNEVEKAINKIRGRMMMRRLPRINQAYYAGIYEFYKNDYDYDNKFLAQLNTVTPEDLKRVANNYLRSDKYLQVIIE